MIARQTGPRLYRRGPGVLRALESVGGVQKGHVLVVGGRTAWAKAQKQIGQALSAGGASSVEFFWYGGQCCAANAERVKAQICETSPSLVIGVGGGKALDPVNLAVAQCSCNFVTVPTIAATCAAWTPVSALYNDAGEYLDLVPSVAPLAVFADTTIIATAPERYLAAGIGDTLAKKYELEASSKSVSPDEKAPAMAALAVGQAAYTVLARWGAAAMTAAREQDVQSESLGAVVDAIIMLAGTVSELGGTAARTAAAHAVYSGLSYLPESQTVFHGELVAFGILVQLCLEERPLDEIHAYLQTAHGAGLPVTLAQCGLSQITHTELTKVARESAAISDMANMPFTVTPDMVLQALSEADTAGRNFLSHKAQ